MSFTLWSVVVGLLLVAMALLVAYVRRLPLTPAMLYLAVGMLLGPHAVGAIQLDPLDWSVLLERLTEVAVVASLFSAGLKLRSPFTDRRWLLPVRLAFVSMAVTVGLITAVGVWLLHLPLGAAVLLGAILAPTDPVLASDVHVEGPFDRDPLRFGLTGEAGLNDGTAFPFVMLGLGLLGLHDLGAGGWRWVAIDVVWAVTGGLAIGAGVGYLVGQVAVFLRRKHRETAGLDELLALGLMALSYGLALLAVTYGFLAAFAAGLALRRIESTEEDAVPAGAAGSDGRAAGALEDHGADAPKSEPAYMAWAVLTFNEQLERLLEVATVLLLGGMLMDGFLPIQALYLVPLLFLVIRPVAVVIGLLGARTPAWRRGYLAWFGIRGIGSIYYLMYAVNHGLDTPTAQLLTGLVFVTAAASITMHGLSVTPLMALYRRRAGAAQGAP